MTISSRTRTVAATVITLAVAAGFWFLLAPTQLGGGSDYVVIHGVSMNPKLHAGDLVVLRPQSSYQVGQVVGYRSGLLHELVLHRIIGVKNGHYLFKGDNNNFVDSYYPVRSELVGRMWVHVPYAGSLLSWARQPRQAAILAALLALAVATSVGAPRVRRRGGSGAQPRPRPATASVGEAGIVTVCALAAASLFAALALVAFTRSTSGPVADPTAYTQNAAYSYRAGAPRSTVYPSGVVRTGDPVYLNLVHRLGLTLYYRFASNLTHTVAGTLALSAQLRSGGGWTQLVGSSPARPFRGEAAKTGVQLDLASLRAKMRAFRSEADIANETFTLTVTPRIAMHGLVGGRAVSSSFAPAPLTFNVDDQSIELAQPPAPTGATVGAPAPNPLSASQPGTVEQVQPALLPLGPLHLGVVQARRIGLAGALICLLLAAGCFAVIRRRRPIDELDSALRRFEPWLVPVKTPLTGYTVDVASAESLANLAAHYDAPILYEQREDLHIFAVEGSGQLYRYWVEEASAADPQPAPADEQELQPAAAAQPVAAQVTAAQPVSASEPDERLRAAFERPMPATRSMVF